MYEKNYFLVGLGQKNKLTIQAYEKNLNSALKKINGYNIDSISLDLNNIAIKNYDHIKASIIEIEKTRYSYKKTDKSSLKRCLLNVSNKLSELNLGIQVVDVQMKRVSYNLQVQEKLFNRMISEQNMIAEKYRAQGQGKKQEILGKQIQKEKQIMSNSYLESQKIKGRADAEATAIYADAYCNLDLSTNKCNK